MKSEGKMKISSSPASGTRSSRSKHLLLKGSLAATGLGLALVFAGCGSSKVSGTYHQAAGGGVMTLEFESGKVTSTVMGQTNHGTYDVKGDQVIMHLPGEGDIPLKINGDGTLDAPAFGTFKKG